MIMKKYTHPVTGMDYKEVDGVFYFLPKFPGQYALRFHGGWVKSGMKRGFIFVKDI